MIFRATMALVADDETRHAAFSWELAAWLTPMLSQKQRAQLAEAQSAAIDEIRGALRAPHADVASLAGMPALPMARHRAKGRFQTTSFTKQALFRSERM